MTTAIEIEDDENVCPECGQPLPAPTDDDAGKPTAATATKSFPEWRRRARLNPAALRAEDASFRARLLARFPLPGQQPAEAKQRSASNHGWDEIAAKINGGA